jgi:hypothetical protein
MSWVMETISGEIKLPSGCEWSVVCRTVASCLGLSSAQSLHHLTAHDAFDYDCEEPLVKDVVSELVSIVDQGSEDSSSVIFSSAKLWKHMRANVSVADLCFGVAVEENMEVVTDLGAHHSMSVLLYVQRLVICMLGRPYIRVLLNDHASITHSFFTS